MATKRHDHHLIDFDPIYEDDGDDLGGFMGFLLYGDDVTYEDVELFLLHRLDEYDDPRGDGDGWDIVETWAWSIIGSYGLDPIDVQRARAEAGNLVELRQAYKKARAANHPDRRDGDRTLWDKVEQAATVLGVSS